MTLAAVMTILMFAASLTYGLATVIGYRTARRHRDTAQLMAQAWATVDVIRDVLNESTHLAETLNTLTDQILRIGAQRRQETPLFAVSPDPAPDTTAVCGPCKSDECGFGGEPHCHYHAVRLRTPFCPLTK